MDADEKISQKEFKKIETLLLQGAAEDKALGKRYAPLLDLLTLSTFYLVWQLWRSFFFFFF
jgi:hypothetical protein